MSARGLTLVDPDTNERHVMMRRYGYIGYKQRHVPMFPEIELYNMCERCAWILYDFGHESVNATICHVQVP